ncbi:hypothetical protein PORY_002380 [Pneumocystis oryctolagi]|uniref:Uncharacterized protein n=1 Tax=Pneumocystis oryctolagi TaxID=42067 RepID=A0ACB7CBJ5_9ASCO|nr:hypothetical protein PORY_002380 [Pneumocystis oryctolagi]
MDPIKNIPKEILKEINELEMFSMNKEKLDYIINKLIEEMNKGLSKDGENIPMFPTWVIGYPEGSEQGTYLTLDIGGTNFRLCKITLLGNGKFDVIQSNYSISKELKQSDADHFFGFIAHKLKEFLEKYHKTEGKVPLGFTFSYPCRQDRINHGVLKHWTKEFNVKNVENNNVVELFSKAIEKEKIPVEVVVLINDTTGTLIASNYVDSETKLGVIYGTGSNASYMEQVKYIPKISHMKLHPDLPIAINCEWGAFDNKKCILPHTKYDIQLDLESEHPGQQIFEKMISGSYLGEIMRQILLDLYEKGLFFKGQSIEMIKIPYSFQTPYLSLIELDFHEDLMEIYKLFKEQFNIESIVSERKIVKEIAGIVSSRAAYLSACGIAAICKKKNIKECSVGTDGSLINKYPNFKEHVCEALKRIFGPDGNKIKLVRAQEGSSIGAAIITAMTIKRKEKNEFVFI